MNKALFVFVFALAAVACADVKFSGMEFTMTCGKEFEPKATWTRPKTNKLDISSEIANAVTVKYNEDNKGLYMCKIPEGNTHYFYVKGKVCENCYELDGAVLIGLIFMDLLITGGVIILIYNCAQRKSISAPSTAPASRRPPPRANGPSVPDRDYEPLNLATRDTSTYAVAGVHRTG